MVEGKRTDSLRVRSAVLAALLVSLLATVIVATGDAKTKPPRDPRLVAPAAMVQAAKREGSVTWYVTAIKDQAQQLANAFEHKYGIKVNFQTFTSGALETRVEAEVKTGNVQADVMQTTVHDLFAAIVDLGGMATLTDLPEWKTYPQRFKNKYFGIVSILPYHLGYNTERLSAPPKSWQEIVDPKYRGQIVILDPRASSATLWFFIYLDRKLGDGWLKALAANNPQVVGSGNLAAPLVASGEKVFGFPLVSGTFPGLKRQGAPIGEAALVPSTAIDQYAGVLAKAPHPNAARLFVNFFLANAGQAAFNGYGYATSPVSSIRGMLPYPKGVPIFSATPKEAEKQKVISLLGLG